MSAVVIDPSRPTPIKTRCIGGSQQMLRIDRESASAIAPHAERELADRIDDQVAKADLVIVSDYTKGSVTGGVLTAAMSAASKRAKPVIVGPKGSGLLQVPWLLRRRPEPQGARSGDGDDRVG